MVLDLLGMKTTQASLMMHKDDLTISSSFESRDVCDDAIRKFNGVGIGEEGLLMNIRYADTPAQKELKRVTAERRQFRTNEYNIGAYGTSLVGMSPTLFNQQSHWRRNIPTSRRRVLPPLRFAS